MFSLLSGLWDYAFSRLEYYVLIVGLDGSGKTTLLEKFKQIQSRKYKGLPPEKITPTVGLNVARVDVGWIRLTFWDLGGQADLQTLWENYYSEAHAVVYVVDSTDRDRLKESKEAFDAMVSNKHLDGVPLLVLANKSDVQGAMTVSEIKEEFNSTAPKLGIRDCKAMSVSGLVGDNVREGLDWVTTRVQRNDARPPVSRDR